ncbi:hypothetical protein BKA61DRAFT_582348 [Leptodontidium sp. MPI-SDFR-AT-0119]|nr:hypothetical protein BKA61DRAFT_582348 [Leptodontidium sp. MPI-SDFR-AT-0119]
MNSALKTERERVIGALPPPFRVVPNFNHPKSQGNRIIIAIAILLPLATFVLSLRIYTKRMIVRTLGSNDFLLLLQSFSSLLENGYNQRTLLRPVFYVHQAIDITTLPPAFAISAIQDHCVDSRCSNRSILCSRII